MNQIPHGDLTVYGSEPAVGDLLAEVLEGLSSVPKTLPTKLFYDEAGSRLFDRICELDEYYPTRTELAIMEQHAGEMAGLLDEGCRLIELGSGSSVKTRILLDCAAGLATYMPIDISRDHLLKTAAELAADYPHIPILPVWADYATPVTGLPAEVPFARTVVYFPGSTIGNFTVAAARDFLRRLSSLCGDEGGLLIGVDLVKDEGVLYRAYNDRMGVTAAFNLNLLTHVNRALGATFDPAAFRHRAFWDGGPGRMEMQLVSTTDQTVRVGAHAIAIGKDEAITTEYSHKYTLAGFADLAASAGFAVRQVWTDPASLFSVQYCQYGV